MTATKQRIKKIDDTFFKDNLYLFLDKNFFISKKAETIVYNVKLLPKDISATLLETLGLENRKKLFPCFVRNTVFKLLFLKCVSVCAGVWCSTKKRWSQISSTSFFISELQWTSFFVQSGEFFEIFPKD